MNNIIRKKFVKRPGTYSHNIHGDYIVNPKISSGPVHMYETCLLIKRKFKEITSIIPYVHYYNGQHQNHLVRRLNKLDGYIPRAHNIIVMRFTVNIELIYNIYTRDKRNTNCKQIQLYSKWTIYTINEHTSGYIYTWYVYISENFFNFFSTLNIQ